MTAMRRALDLIAIEAVASYRDAFQLAVQRLADDWVYRNAVGRAFGIPHPEALAMTDAEIRARALIIVEIETRRAGHYSHNFPRHLACKEIAEAARRRIAGNIKETCHDDKTDKAH